MDIKIGFKYNRLTVINLSKKRNGNRKNYDCLCDCGKFVTVIGSSLIRGTTKSCGCYQKEMARKAKTTHGLSYSSEHNIWSNMIARCGKVQNNRYHRYGGRGIYVCKRWASSFQNFYSDMGDRPSSKHTIDRIDNNKGYSPKNCRWATQKQQSRNTSRNVYMVENGEKIIVADFEKKYNLYRGAIYYFMRSGLNNDQILEKVKNEGVGKNIYCFNGENKTIKYWALKYNIKLSTFYNRHKKLKSIEKCLIYFKKI
jgi:hypothetical protein